MEQSALMRAPAAMPMTEFNWLTEDRYVQRTVFGGGIEMVANFGSAEYRRGEMVIPKRSILARWRNTGETKIYSLSEKPE